jgi:Mn2+/Fe2+ NRAMP family transporter
MVDAILSIASVIGWAVGLALFCAMTVLAFVTLRHRRVVMMQRDATERIKAFHDRQ